MELNIQTQKPNGKPNGYLLINKESRSIKPSSHTNGHTSTFDPNKYMLKLPKTKKVSLPNVQVRFEKTETGAIGRELVICGYGTLQALEFDEQDRIADAPREKAKKRQQGELMLLPP